LPVSDNKAIHKKYSAKKILYINFEDDRLLTFNASHFQLLLDAYKSLFKETPVLFLDEIQNIDGWEKFSRRLADSKEYKIFITGSNAKMLSKEMATTLGGRYLIKNIYPFSFSEYLAANKVKLTEHWQFSNKRYEIRRKFNDFFKASTVIEYLNFLEESFLIFSVKNCLAKITERESQKKYYFIDNGLITIMQDSPETKLLENLVAINLRKRFGSEFYFAKDGAEVDFYIPKTKTLIQVAYSLSRQTEERELDSMLKIRKKLEAKKNVAHKFGRRKNNRI